MSDNKTDRASLRRHAQRKESYATLVSKRKYMLSINRINPNKKLRIDTMRSLDLLNTTVQDYEEEEKGMNTDIISISSPTSSTDSSQDFKFRISTNFKEVRSCTVQNEPEVSSVMTRSATRKYASVGALHNKVDWVQQLKVKKRWPIDVAYPVPEPIVQNTELRELLSISLTEVMSFCKNVWSLNNELRVPQNEDQFVILKEIPDFFHLPSYLTQETEIKNENDDISKQQKIINLISIKDNDQRESFYIQQENEECETVTLHSDGTYVISEECWDESGLNQIQDIVYEYNPIIAILNDHNYAQKCDITPTRTLKVEHLKTLNKEEKEFKIENVLNDLLLNTAMLKCLVYGESPQDMISFLDKAQSFYS